VPGTRREEIDRIADGIATAGPPPSLEGFVELVPALARCSTPAGSMPR